MALQTQPINKFQLRFIFITKFLLNNICQIMCGLAYLKRNDSHSPVKPLLARYSEQKHRGQQGFGFVAVKKGKVIGYERSTGFEEIEKKLQDYTGADEIMFHHRLPTSTQNLEETAHPIFVSNKILKHDYYLIHNGVIGNPATLKMEHEALGFEYNTEVELFSGYKQKHKKNKKKQQVKITKTEFNDSESLAIEFALYNEGIKKEIETRGSAAFICYEVKKDSGEVVALHYGRNNNPIKAYRAHGMFVLSSESKDQGHVDVEDYKCVTIPYVNGVQTTGSVKVMRLDSSFSDSRTSGWSGASASHTGSGYSGYPPVGHTNHAIGYDVRTHKRYPSLADDIEDSQKKNTLQLPAGTLNCIHGYSLKSAMCGLCLMSGKESNVIEITCARTGLVTNVCFCKMHRKESKRLKREAKIESKKEGATQLELGIESPYQDKDGSHYCSVCDGKIKGAQYLDKSTKEWVHFECQPESKDNTIVGNDYTDRLKANYANIEDEIDALESEIDALEEQINLFENDGTKSEEWFYSTMRLEKAQTNLSAKERELKRISQYMDAF